MFTIRTIAAAAAAVAAIGCASPQPPKVAGPFVRPFESVRHGMDADTLYRTGRYLQGQQRFEQAEDSYRRALDAQPTHVDALNALGVIYSLHGRAALAEQSFRLAIKADPLAARVHNNLGYHLMREGRAAEAIASYERARELEPGNAGIAANLASAQATQKMPVQAQAPVAVPVQAATSAPAAVAPAVAAVVPPPVSASVPVPLIAPVPATAPAAVAIAVTTVTPMPVPQAPVASVVPGQTQRIEIANGNGATGLARRVWSTVRLVDAQARFANDKPYGVAVSRIQYVQGAELLARDINARLATPLPMVAVASLKRDTRVRVLLGKDFSQGAIASSSTTRSHS